MDGTKSVPIKISESAGPSHDRPSNSCLSANHHRSLIHAHAQKSSRTAVASNELLVRRLKGDLRTTAAGFSGPTSRSTWSTGQETSRATGTGTTTGSAQASIHNERRGDPRDPSKKSPERVPPFTKEDIKTRQALSEGRCTISIVCHCCRNSSDQWSLFLDRGGKGNILSEVGGTYEHPEYRVRRDVRPDPENLRGTLPVASIRRDQVGIYEQLVENSFARVCNRFMIDSRQWCLAALTSLNAARIIDVDVEDIQIRADSPFEFSPHC